MRRMTVGLIGEHDRLQKAIRVGVPSQIGKVLRKIGTRETGKAKVGVIGKGMIGKTTRDHEHKKQHRRLLRLARACFKNKVLAVGN